MERVIALADEINKLLPYKLRSFYSLEDIEEYYQAVINKDKNDIKRA
ncbi:hypothetical protein KHA80_00760 [Anaerobacillus sp. HL2]|nr:hypothetical protein KHA80_00760 [Anaerobacillus sp. HL2]